MDLHNHFLNALSEPDKMALRPALDHIRIERDQPLARAGSQVEHVVLPVNCVISAVAVMKDGRSVETRTIGCESGFGLLHALGSRYSYEDVATQIGGHAWRLPVGALAHAAACSPTLVRAIVRHAQATLIQTAQSAACNSLHTVPQRLARWLLLTRERTGEDILPLTQEHLSVMLGVQRTTVTAAATDLQARGLMSYARGRIRILDRPGLIATACECYEDIETAGKRVMADA